MEKQITFKRYCNIYSIFVDGVKQDLYIEKSYITGSYLLYKGYKHPVALKGGFGNCVTGRLRDMKYYVTEIINGRKEIVVY